MAVICLLDTLGAGAKEEEVLEGMQEEEGEEEEGAYDEHVWLSLKNAQAFCTVITDALSSLDADHAAAYKSNLTSYNEKLSALDAEYQAAADAAPVKTLLFGDRFPFRYLVDDYGLAYHAAFPGCSAETEASFETIVFLADKVGELDLKTVIVLESSDQSIANTIIDNTAGKNQQILVLDSMQSVTESDVQNGATYLSIMESNLNVLKEALQ
jgi:zinc transport system substrate-binding protein